MRSALFVAALVLAADIVYAQQEEHGPEYEQWMKDV